MSRSLPSQKNKKTHFKRDFPQPLTIFHPIFIPPISPFMPTQNPRNHSFRAALLSVWPLGTFVRNQKRVGEENPTSACSPVCCKAHHKKDLERSESAWTWAWPYQEKEKLGLGDTRWKAGQGSPASERTAGRGFPSRLLVFLSIYKCSLYTKVQPCLSTMSAMVGPKNPLSYCNFHQEEERLEAWWLSDSGGQKFPRAELRPRGQTHSQPSPGGLHH